MKTSQVAERGTEEVTPNDEPSDESALLETLYCIRNMGMEDALTWLRATRVEAFHRGKRAAQEHASPHHPGGERK